MSHAGGTVTSSPNLTEGWFPVYPLLQPPFFFHRHRWRCQISPCQVGFSIHL